MGSWLFKTPVGPQAHYLNPIQFYTIKKEKAELGSAIHEAKRSGIGKSSTARQVASMAGGMIYLTFLFQFCFRVYSAFVQNQKFMLTVGIRASYLCLGVLYGVANCRVFSVCIPAFLF